MNTGQSVSVFVGNRLERNTRRVFCNLYLIIGAVYSSFVIVFRPGL